MSNSSRERTLVTLSPKVLTRHIKKNLLRTITYTKKSYYIGLESLSQRADWAEVIFKLLIKNIYNQAPLIEFVV
jgi:hypothetical protein